MTREVRWFFEGEVPGLVSRWFESSAPVLERERRVDTYDVDASRRRIGIKVRGEKLFDSKLLLSVSPGVLLAPGVVGHVEDWLKITEPAHGETKHLGAQRVQVSKTITTRRYSLTGRSGDLPIGCDVELARVSMGGLRAWSICFETFGLPEVRQEALEAGVEGLLGESPLPPGLVLRGSESFSYPEWIGRIHSKAGLVR
jgi:hypothetical protein